MMSGCCMLVLLGNVLWIFQEVQWLLLIFDECLCMLGLKKSVDGSIEEVGDMVVYVVGYFVIYGKQLFYFKDLIFQVCVVVLVLKVSDKLIQMVIVEEGEGIMI